jgi:Probable N6-adenine methyltransferase
MAGDALEPRFVHEDHQREQYFFDPPTLDHLADFVAGYVNPACVCAPMLGRALADRGVDVAVLDIDTRFADLPRFREFNVGRPVPTGESYGLIVCDPPFFTVSLSTLFGALRMLAGYDFEQPLLIGYLARRAAALTGTFHRFGLVDTGYEPGYLTVQPVERNRIRFYGNLGANAHRRLAASG